MADQIPISGLPAAPSAQLTDILPVVQGGVTDKESLAQIQTLFNITSTSTLPIAKLNLVGSSSGTISITAQAAAGTFNFNLPITAGTSGYLLTSAGGGSSPMTWTNPATLGGVTSGQGTANQVLVNSTSASPQTGALIFTTPQDIATTSGVRFGSLGLGLAAPGTSGYLQTVGFTKLGSSSSFLNVATHELAMIDNTGIFLNTYFTGTMTHVSAGGAQACVELQPTFSATSGSWLNADGIFLNPTISMGANLSAGAGIRIIPTFSSGNTFTTASYANFRSAAASAGGFAGTLTNFYGFYGEALNLGTNRYSGFFLAPTGGTIAIAAYADNASIGYNVTPPSNGLLVNGQMALGTSSATSNVKLTLTSASLDKYSIFASGTLSGDDGTRTVGCYLNYTLGPINNSLTTIGLYNIPAITPAGSNTIIEADGAYFSLTGTLGSGTVSAAYSAKFIAPTIGTVKVASYHDNISVGYTGVTPPTNGSIISGQTIFKATSSFISASVEIQGADRVSLGIGGTKTITDGVVQTSIYLGPTYAPTSTTTSVANILSYPQFNPPTGVTITTAYNIFLQAGGQGGLGSVTTGINFYAENPGFGTTKWAIYANGAVRVPTIQISTSPTNGYVLTSDASGNGTWQATGAVTASQWPITTVNGNYTVLTSDAIILVNSAAPCTITLPACNVAADGKWFIVKDSGNSAGAHPITVAITVPGQIQGSFTYTINTAYGAVLLINKVADLSYYILGTVV